jgi:hypothetical protein
MLKLDNVTLVLIDSLDDFCDKTNIRIATMSRILPKILEDVSFGNILSINPFNKNSNLIDKRIEQKIWNRNSEEIHHINWYCEFVVSKLPYIVTTDYYLIMQWDGFIVDTNYWNDDFYKFDYIGGGHSLLNGGFSLRKTEAMKNIIENGNPQSLHLMDVSSEDHLYSCYLDFEKHPTEFNRKNYDLPIHIEWPGNKLINKFCCQIIYNDKELPNVDYNYGWSTNSFGWHRSGHLGIELQINQYKKLNIFTENEINKIKNYLSVKDIINFDYKMEDYSIDYNTEFFNY